MSEKPRSRIMPPTVLAALVLFMSIVLGGVAGLALDRKVLHPCDGTTAGQRGRTPFWALTGEDHRRYWNDLSRSLDLTAPQKAAIDSVLSQQARQLEANRSDVEPRVRAVLRTTRVRIDSLLTPEQRARLEQLHKERRARRHRP